MVTPSTGRLAGTRRATSQRMISSYKLRTLVHRTVLPDGTVLTPGQEGPDIGPDFPLGTFAEDYEYLKGAGTLDEYNGRFARTPEYPEGTYAYFLTSWPYLVGPKYAGQMPGMVRPLAPKAVNLITENPKAGQPTTLTLCSGTPGVKRSSSTKRSTNSRFT